MKDFKVLFSFLLAGFFSYTAYSQANSGQNPELVFYKYYSAIGGGQPVTEIGDSIGSLRFRAMTAKPPVTWREGASITSRITGPFDAHTLPANLIFRTGATGPVERMVVTAEGLVGIGTLIPTFDLHTVGNTHTTGNFYGRIHFDDNQATDDAPNTYNDESYFELKQRAVLGVPAGMGTHGGLLSLAPGASSNDHQLFFADDGIFTRRWNGGAGSWAGSIWHKLLTGEDINGTPNRVAKFTGPNSIGDSQLWDDGAQVGIGTTSPAAGFFLDVAGNTHIGGRVAIGTANTPNMLGINNTSGYNLFVAGGILTEEVLVRTGWADYVFEESYPLKDLEEVEQHIREKGHLPGVPSAAQVEESGLGLAENAVNQQVKIEELFLYVIELNKEVKALKEENEQLKAKIEALGNR
jgi:hypothetical protein